MVITEPKTIGPVSNATLFQRLSSEDFEPFSESEWIQLPDPIKAEIRSKAFRAVEKNDFAACKHVVSYFLGELNADQQLALIDQIEGLISLTPTEWDTLFILLYKKRGEFSLVANEKINAFIASRIDLLKKDISTSQNIVQSGKNLVTFYVTYFDCFTVVQKEDILLTFVIRPRLYESLDADSLGSLIEVGRKETVGEIIELAAFQYLFPRYLDLVLKESHDQWGTVLQLLAEIRFTEDEVRGLGRRLTNLSQDSLSQILNNRKPEEALPLLLNLANGAIGEVAYILLEFIQTNWSLFSDECIKEENREKIIAALSILHEKFDEKNLACVYFYLLKLNFRMPPTLLQNIGSFWDSLTLYQRAKLFYSYQMKKFAHQMEAKK